jgi:hypothetical protein
MSVNQNCEPCPHCEQMHLVGEFCKCYGATKERKIKESIEQAVGASKKLFAANANKDSFRTKTPIEILPFLEQCITLVAYSHVNGITIDVNGICKAKISIGANEKIDIERIETVKQKL